MIWTKWYTNRFTDSSWLLPFFSASPSVVFLWALMFLVHSFLDLLDLDLLNLDYKQCGVTLGESEFRLQKAWRHACEMFANHYFAAAKNKSNCGTRFSRSKNKKHVSKPWKLLQHLHLLQAVLGTPVTTRPTRTLPWVPSVVQGLSFCAFCYLCTLCDGCSSFQWAWFPETWGRTQEEQDSTVHKET